MEVLRFRISGYMAHFRKVYSNSTSLTYFFPPRTTVMGLLAGAMGRDRDSYYEDFSDLKIAVIPRTQLRKLVFAESYLDTDSLSADKFRGIGNRVPTTREFVVGDQGLTYEVWVAEGKEFERALRYPVYPPSLGPANLLAWVHDVRVEECTPVQEISGEVVGVVRANLVDVTPESGQKVVVEELVPREFDGERHSGPLVNYYLEVRGRPIRVKGKAEGVRCGETAVFM
ncbi:CRISPR-associated protein Cas5 [Metallosphaera javensis (ex Sakai et al. 2022)]|uniref:CRISPR-associated protein Cas5 n=1 Tax=Metallosphaera javensis (ex Sakai et al. 2022) TaxID=2775498 RepID=UPI00258F7005|nr:MAG: type I-B CRISPR-associated protein Cas5 [Metallosphaera javensis (ex Sakai et al. 2022)]